MVICTLAGGFSVDRHGRHLDESYLPKMKISCFW